MKSFSRGWGLAVLSLAVLGVAGCNQDNEAFVRAQKEAAEAKGVKADPNAPPQAKTQQEYYKQQQASSPFSKSSGYPGAK